MKRFGNIFAFFALLTLVSMPLTPALASFFAKAGQIIEICTTQGIKTIVFDENGVAHEQDRPHDSAEHCPYCLGRFAVPLLPQTNILEAPDSLLGYTDFISAEPNITPQDVYKTYRPRDPPAFSA